MAVTDAPATLAELRTDFLQSMKEYTGSTVINEVADRYLNKGLQDLHQERWPWTERRSTIRTQPPYQTGTVDIAIASLTTRLTVTGTGTAWATLNSYSEANASPGMKLLLGSSRVVHLVASVPSDTTMTLDASTPWSGTEALAAGSYSLYQDEYRLPADFDDLIDTRFFDDDRTIPLVGAQEFYAAHARNTIRGRPRLATLIVLAPAVLPQATATLVNYVTNGDFETWPSATSTPTGWTLTGGGAQVSRQTSTKYGAYMAQVSRAGGQDASLTQDVMTTYGPATAWQGQTVTVGCWVYATVADRARIGITDGVTTSVSAYHPGTSTWQWLTVTHSISASAGSLTVSCQVNTAATSASFDGATLVFGTSLADYVSLTPVARVRRRVVFSPAPDRVYVIPYRYSTTLLAVSATGTSQTNLTAATDIPIVPLRFRQAIVWKALELWFSTRQKSAELAAHFQAEYSSLLLRARQKSGPADDRPRLIPAVAGPPRRGWSGRYEGGIAFDELRY